MWVVIGSKERTERVPGGRQVERHCSECGETAMFYERRATSTLQLYFLDVYELKSRHVMACGACGALYATDEVGNETKDSGPAFVRHAERVGGAITAGAKTAFEKVQAAARDALGSSTASRETPQDRDRDRDPDPDLGSDDPLADEDEALEAKFRALEKKVRIATD